MDKENEAEEQDEQSTRKKNLIQDVGISYKCFDCGKVSDINGVDIYEQNNVMKYVCRECRGRCLPEDELATSKGVKSVKQKSNRGGIISLLIFIVALIFVIINVYNYQIVARDFNKYILHSKHLRNSIEPHLKYFWEDHKLLEKAEALAQKTDNDSTEGDEKVEPEDNIDPQLVKEAEGRVERAKIYILKQSYLIDSIKIPETEQIKQLYEAEVSFWSNPTYANYIKYMGVYNKLRLRYDNKYITAIRNRIKQIHQKKEIPVLVEEDNSAEH